MGSSSHMTCRLAEAGQEQTELLRAESQTTQLLRVSLVPVLQELSGEDASESTVFQKKPSAGLGWENHPAFPTHIFKIAYV